jgi:predicted SAM-dependent methyltransferase
MTHSIVRGTRTVLNLLPAALTRPVLGLWRRYYWWRKRRIVPGRNRKVVDTLLARGAPIRLELGSWTRPELAGWTFSDINGNGDLQLDLTAPIPFPDDTVDKVYSSHLIEHFAYPAPMMDLLRECHRILRPGGEFSVAVPNARIFLEAYLSGRELPQAKYFGCEVGLSFATKIDYINFSAYLGGEHKHMFDEENLVAILAAAGFREVRVRPFDPPLDLESRRHESLYATGIK